MYFNEKNNFFHGIMFHHFHDEGIHKKGQGSINKDEFRKIINFIGRDNILDAAVFFEKLKNNELKENEVCITFDDAMKCQLDVAIPVLEDFKIKSFFFVYSSMFEGKPNYLEIYRYFRNNCFNNIDEFYKNFYQVLDKNLETFFENKQKKIDYTKVKFPFYSVEDIKFRLVRDYFLSTKQYDEVMFKVMKNKKFKYDDHLEKIFFQKRDLKVLDELGHIIGLHSHSHPTLLENLNYDEQKSEYKKCITSISSILNKPINDIKCMSHPCGSYGRETLEILKELGIELGFKQTMSIEKEKGMKKINNSLLEIAREDHSNILKKIN